MARKSVIEEPDYHGRGDKSTITYYDLIEEAPRLEEAPSCWRLQGFPIIKDSTVKDTSI